MDMYAAIMTQGNATERERAIPAVKVRIGRGHESIQLHGGIGRWSTASATSSTTSSCSTRYLGMPAIT
ncbi:MULTISPECIES: hypothetical protein [unclassified Bradyrhizobium]|uniref:hypothetical protein n=1 Tax=unclassified Bradyrhizobium TaxID=2631580 RepID=UPI001FF8947D|nr:MULTISPECIES: hypothetical protein [unclassified Bradyrhizobium]MCK1612273.1 hypothetical protein [Bradyrhizobium sp. 163]MCK1767371.1 hypothetical protein [Bradyrhizobium sp. 136]